MQVIIGGYTAEMDGAATGVRSLVADDANPGELTEVMTLPLPSPTYLIAHPVQQLLFAVTEGSPSQLHSIGRESDGRLSLVSSVESAGDSACHLALAPDGLHLVVAHYGSGSVSSFAIGEGGVLSPQIDLLALDGSGPDAERQAGSHAHQVVFDRDELLVADLGGDRIHRLRLGVDGELSIAAEPVALPPGSGPRHLVVLGDYLVVACELSAEVWLGGRTDDGWVERQTVLSSTASVADRISPSAVRADGDTLYVANRGAGTVAVLTLDRLDGRLNPVTEFRCGGEWPRDLVIADDLIWVANQTNDLVAVFDRSALPSVERVFELASPSPASIVLLDDRGKAIA
jgi:6-phosphogluconolactonase